jgi:hypothetical protein
MDSIITIGKKRRKIETDSLLKAEVNPDVVEEIDHFKKEKKSISSLLHN